ncbi:MAG TPA: hypothetical protein VFV03_06825, partial [Solirubrobacteraceae bacterium]|nr:hypothetical protein [Solirubrobacteraceae bacterium]
MESIQFDTAPSNADRDVAVLGVYKFGALSSVVAGLFGLYMAHVESLSPRQRLVARIGALGTAGLGIATLRAPVPVTAVLRRRLNPWALPALGLAGIAVSGADRSPVLYPALMLTALGGGRLGPTRLRGYERTASLVLGVAAAGGYLCVVIGARRPWRHGWERGLLWNVGMAPVFLANALLGGELGDLALALRCVERTRVRDRAALDAARRSGQGGLRHVAETIGEVAAELEQTLLGLAARHRLHDDPTSLEVGRAVERIRGNIKHHLLVPLLVAAANDESRDLPSSLEAMLTVYREGWREHGISIPLDR